MTRREIASLVIKLMGIFILFKCIAFLPAGISSIFHGISSLDHQPIFESLFIIMISSMATTIPVIFSLLVIFLSDKAAAFLIKDDQDAQVSSSINKDDAMTIAVSCMGLYFIIAAVPLLINGVWSNSIMRMGMPAIHPSAAWTLFRTIIAPAVQVGLGIWLFAGSSGIVKLWKKIRS